MKKMLNNGCFVSKIHSTNVFGRTGILKFYESHVYFDLSIMSVGFYLKRTFETLMFVLKLFTKIIKLGKDKFHLSIV